MLVPHALDIADKYLISYYFTVLHFPTFNFIFVKSSYTLISGITKKMYDPRKNGRIDRSTERVNIRSLTELLFCILQNSRKKVNSNRAGLTHIRFY